MTDFRKLRTIEQLAAESGGAFSQAALRWKIFNSKEIGLDPAIVRLGRRVLIDVDEFNRWIEQERSRPIPRPAPRMRRKVAEAAR